MEGLDPLNQTATEPHAPAQVHAAAGTRKLTVETLQEVGLDSGIRARFRARIVLGRSRVCSTAHTAKKFFVHSIVVVVSCRLGFKGLRLYVLRAEG